MYPVIWVSAAGIYDNNQNKEAVEVSGLGVIAEMKFLLILDLLAAASSEYRVTTSPTSH